MLAFRSLRLGVLSVGACAALGAQAQPAAATPFVLPAYTAYASPDPGAMTRPRDGSVTKWSGTLHWHIRCAAGGELRVRLVPTAHAKAAEPCTLELTVAGAAQTLAFAGDAVEARAEIAAAGPVELALRCTAGAAPPLQTLELSGAAAVGMHASTVERRNCASVHLGYEVEPTDAASIEWCYCEATPRTDPLWSYYMAVGFSRGYFGMQVNSPTERRVIFSVWDSGNEAIDRRKVKDEDLVQMVAKGEGVVAESFGHEGTGGHSHRVTPWSLGGTFGFLVHAAAEGTHTTYTGWFRAPGGKEWELIASFRAPKDGGLLRGLYSFDENFAGENGDLRRDCEFGQQWVRTRGGEWRELVRAHFTHDGHGKAQRLDRSGGVRGDRFYLRTGGFGDDADPTAVTRYGATLARAAAGARPECLAALPQPPSSPSSPSPAAPRKSAR